MNDDKKNIAVPQSLPTDFPTQAEEDQEKHRIAEGDEGESDFAGSAPDPELVQQKDTLDMEHELGRYTKEDEEHPAELNPDGNIAEEDE